MHHPQVVQSPIFNHCLKVNLDGHNGPQIVQKLSLQVPVREIHNSLVSDPVDCGLKEARDAENNIIISDYTLCSLFSPQLKKILSRYKVMCGCECCIYAKGINSSLISWRDWYLKKLKDQSQNDQNRRSGGKSNCIYEKYKNTFMPLGNHIYAKTSDMEKAKMCAYPQSDHALPH